MTGQRRCNETLLTSILVLFILELVHFQGSHSVLVVTSEASHFSCQVISAP